MEEHRPLPNLSVIRFVPLWMIYPDALLNLTAAFEKFIQKLAHNALFKIRYGGVVEVERGAIQFGLPCEHIHRNVREINRFRQRQECLVNARPRARRTRIRSVRYFLMP